MENVKLIVSSKSLHRSLLKWEWMNWDDKGEGVIEIGKNKMQFKNAEVSLDIETRGDGEYTYPKQLLKRLRKVCAAIQEQPITLTLSHSNIEVHPPIFV